MLFATTFHWIGAAKPIVPQKKGQGHIAETRDFLVEAQDQATATTYAETFTATEPNPSECFGRLLAVRLATPEQIRELESLSIYEIYRRILA